MSHILTCIVVRDVGSLDDATAAEKRLTEDGWRIDESSIWLGGDGEDTW